MTRILSILFLLTLAAMPDQSVLLALSLLTLAAMPSMMLRR
jgi:hypothetical protein